MALPSFDAEAKPNWDALQNFLNFPVPSTLPNRMTFPPSPECSIEDNSSVEPLTPSEFLLPSPIDDNDNCSTSIEVQNVTPTKYPSPSATPPLTYPSPPENQLGSTSTSEPSNIVRRRGPGRPSKAQLAADRQQPMGGSLISMRRQAHNEQQAVPEIELRVRLKSFGTNSRKVSV